MSTNGMNDLLMGSGLIGFAEAAAAVPFLFMTPNNTDPDMTPVKTIIKAIQSTLNKFAGASLGVDGVMGPKTATALRAVVPKSLEVGTTRWYELLQYARNSKIGVIPSVPSVKLPQLTASGFMNPWVIGGGIALLILLTKKKGRR